MRLKICCLLGVTAIATQALLSADGPIQVKLRTPESFLTVLEDTSPLSPQVEGLREIQEYVTEVKELAYKTAEAILSIPANAQTFDNTLRPWNRLSSKIARGINRLQEKAKVSYSSSATSSYLTDLYFLSLEGKIIVPNSTYYTSILRNI